VIKKFLTRCYRLQQQEKNDLTRYYRVKIKINTSKALINHRRLAIKEITFFNIALQQWQITEQIKERKNTNNHIQKTDTTP
jgi:hypothetical protein